MKNLLGVFVVGILSSTVAMAGSSSWSDVQAWDQWTAEGTEIGVMPETDWKTAEDEMIEDWSDWNPLQLVSATCTTVKVVVNQSARPQTLSAWCDGSMILDNVLTSTGTGKRTPYGTFTVYNKIPMAYSGRYNNAPMARFLVFKDCGPKRPNCIGIHATIKANYEKLGSPASKGCVRLTMANAQLLWDYAIGSGEVVVTVQ